MILVLALLFLFIHPSANKETAEKIADDGTEEEYDFMGSPEGVSAKLDLARAYLAMQDYQQMREVLQAVLQQGNSQQKQQAQDLLDKIPESS